MFKPIRMTIHTDSSDMYNRLEHRMRTRGSEFIGGTDFMCVSVSRSSSGIKAELEEFTRAHASWCGEGVPPVGFEFEWRYGDSDWKTGEALYIGPIYIILKTSHGGEQHYYVRGMEFRPIRTPEQIAAEKRDKEINAIAEILTHDGTFYQDAERLYDAGYRQTDVK